MNFLRRINLYFWIRKDFFSDPGKIVDAYPMDKSFRYEVDRLLEPEIKHF